MYVHPKSWRGHCVAAHCTRGDWSYPSELVMVGGNHESSSPTSHMSGFTLVVGVLLSSVRHVAVATLLSTLSLAALISRSSLNKLYPTSPPVVLTRLHYFIVFFLSARLRRTFFRLFYAKVAVWEENVFIFLENAHVLSKVRRSQTPAAFKQKSIYVRKH